jgi:DNA-binding HxlR family transcriptional regulator
MAINTTGYGQYCPVSRAVEVLGERWSFLILRDLLVGTTRFNDLARGLPGLSRSILSKRLGQFERAGLLEHVGDDYLLTEAGRDLMPVLIGLGQWGTKWTFGDPRPAELDPELLVWWMHTRFDTTLLPDGRTVFHVRFTDEPRRFWIVIDSGVPSVCKTDPGYDVDVTMTSDLTSLYQIWLGRMGLAEATRAGRIAFDGHSSLTGRMSRILLMSPLAASPA